MIVQGSRRRQVFVECLYDDVHGDSLWAASDRRVRAPGGRHSQAAPRVGVAVRAHAAGSLAGRLPALHGGRRRSRGADAARARAGSRSRGGRACCTRGRAAVRGDARGPRRSPACGDRPLRRGRRSLGARREPCRVRPGGIAAPGGVARLEGGRRRLEAGRDRGQRGALREQPDPRQAACACPVLGPRNGPSCSSRLCTRRDARHHPARVRTRPALALLADSLSRRGHADRNARPRGRDDAAGARCRLELRPRPARRAGRRPPPARPGRCRSRSRAPVRRTSSPSVSAPAAWTGIS